MRKPSSTPRGRGFSWRRALTKPFSKKRIRRFAQWSWQPHPAAQASQQRRSHPSVVGRSRRSFAASSVLDSRLQLSPARCLTRCFCQAPVASSVNLKPDDAFPRVCDTYPWLLWWEDEKCHFVRSEVKVRKERHCVMTPSCEGWGAPLRCGCRTWGTRSGRRSRHADAVRSFTAQCRVSVHVGGRKFTLIYNWH